MISMLVSLIIRQLLLGNLKAWHRYKIETTYVFEWLRRKGVSQINAKLREKSDCVNAKKKNPRKNDLQ